MYTRRAQPAPVEAASGYSLALRNVGRPDEAERVVVEALKRDGLSLEQDTELQMRYMSLLGDRGEGEEALRRAEVLDARLERIGALLAARLQRAPAPQRFGDAEQAPLAHDGAPDGRDGGRAGAKALQLVALTEE